MSKTLILAEKPSVGKEIAKTLGVKKGANGYIEGDKYIITWGLGHLVTLAEPEHYGDKFKTWDLATLPMLPQKMELKIINETSKQYKTVKSLLQRSDVTSIIIATDAGREGELVARWILIKAGCKKPFTRLWISSQTTKAIKDGFAHLKPGKDYDNLYRAAEARAEADWLVGLNVTRALTCKFNAQLSAGRVQTPTLALIVKREEEIRRFVPKDYYTVKADLGSFFAVYQTAIYDKVLADKIAEQIKGQNFKVISVQKNEISTPVPLLYDLTELQRDANKAYGFSPKETLSIMQRLYENHKALTYPRTDSRYLTDDIVPTLKDRLAISSFGEFSPIVSEIIKFRYTFAKSNINNAKVSDHHAIIPTEERVNLSNMTSAEKQIYFMVIRRFLCGYLPDYKYRQIKVKLQCGEFLFISTGKVVLDFGWKKLYHSSNFEDVAEETEQTLPDLQQNQLFKCKNIQLKAQKTKAPSRYTEASLLSAMENPSKFIEDNKMKSFISAGLGTPATRADIIEKLYSAFYVEKKGSSMHPTSKGIQLIDLAPSELAQPLLTATWEQELEQISKGKANKTQFIEKIREYSTKLVNQVKTSSAKYTHDNIDGTPCPQCGGVVLKVQGKRGSMLVCADKACGFRKSISLHSKTRCPNCHKIMEIFGEGDAKIYVCPCGFREKVEKFHAKYARKEEASKQDLNKYMKTDSDSKFNNPMADALAKLLEK